MMASGVSNKTTARFDGAKLRLPDGRVIESVATRWDKGALIVSVVPEFVAWLNENKSFAYDGGVETRYTARKETRKRGGDYWYAFAFIGGKTVKRYIGKTGEIDAMKVMSVGLQFVGLRRMAKLTEDRLKAMGAC